MKRLWLILLILLPGLSALCQTTRVRGTVIDAELREPIPYAGVFFKGTTTGQSADVKGEFSIETSDPAALILVCQHMGYQSSEIKIRPGEENVVEFRLKIDRKQLGEVRVKADDRKAKRLLANIEAHRSRNNPEKSKYYDCDIYSKIDLGIANFRDFRDSAALGKAWGFVSEYVQNNPVSGKRVLPVMMSESMIKRYHRSEPELNNEEITANRISGINPDANLLTQFTGSMHLKCNFYDDFVNCFDVEFPSPTQSAGLLYYNYFIVDSLQIDGRKTYKVRYHPKKSVSSPVLDGEMMIDAEDFALYSITAKMVKRGDVNWVRDLLFENSYKRLEDGSWFYEKEHLYVDLSLTQQDSSSLASIVGNRNIYFMEPSFVDNGDILDRGHGIVKVDEQANYRDEQYWEKVRPMELSASEAGVYEMVDRIQETKAYKVTYSIIEALVNGYYDVGPVGFGPYHKLISFNPLEQFRPQIGIHTSKNLSKKFRFTGYIAYGIRDREVKGGFSYEQMFSKYPTRKLTFDASYDVVQLGKGTGPLTDVNFLSSLLGGFASQKLVPLSNFSLKYEHEFSMNFNFTVDAALKRYYGNSFVPMIQLDGQNRRSIATNELHTRFRFSWQETVNRGHFIKKYIHSNYPVIALDLTGSIPGLRSGDVGFFCPELTMDWKARIPPVGISDIRISGGTVVGKVPWQLLHLHEGNATFMMDKTAFACMDYFEFASDSWVTFILNHNFNGYFFNMIPFMRKLDWREQLSFKMAYGVLSDKNNPTLPGADPTMIAFPEGLKTMGSMPYMEIGCGVSNILNLFRFDFFWRLTHRETAARNFAFTFGLELRF